MDIIRAVEKIKPIKSEITNLGIVTRCPNCGAIQLKILPHVDIQYCVRCDKAFDFSNIDFGLYYNDIDIKG